MARAKSCLLICLSSLLFLGCIHRLPASRKAVIPAAFAATCHQLSVLPTAELVVVRLRTQSLDLFTNGVWERSYPCSTSRYGAGEKMDSHQTPRGLHCIQEKFGASQPAGTVFRERLIVPQSSATNRTTAITTRIMWLTGLQPGFNQGRRAGISVDTHDREIYLHGTPDQTTIGRPVSYGCIHLGDQDLIELFDRLPPGTLVWIDER